MPTRSPSKGRRQLPIGGLETAFPAERPRRRPGRPRGASAGESPSLLTDGSFLRLWFIGFVSFLIRWMEILVFGIVTYDLTNSAAIVAMMTMLRLLPMGLFGVYFGVLVARIRRDNGLQWVVSISLLTSLVLAGVAHENALEVWHLGAASFINGTAWAIDNPLRRAVIGDIAGPQRMGRAMAIDVGTSNASRLAGPGIGGLLLAGPGIELVFACAAGLYLLALLAALTLKEPYRAQTTNVQPFLKTLRGGFMAARGNPRLLGVMWATIVFNWFGWPVLSMVPVIGADRLGLASDGIGLLASMDGLGALIGAIALAPLARPGNYGRFYFGGILLFLIMLPVFGLSRHAFLAGLALLLVGAGQSAFAVMQATITYVSAPVNRRAEAMGILTMCIGTGPLGFLFLGWLAQTVGASYAAVISGSLGVLVMAITYPWWRQTLLDRPAPPTEAT